jgi:hypothetical protein
MTVQPLRLVSKDFPHLCAGIHCQICWWTTARPADALEKTLRKAAVIERLDRVTDGAWSRNTPVDAQ